MKLAAKSISSTPPNKYVLFYAVFLKNIFKVFNRVCFDFLEANFDTYTSDVVLLAELDIILKYIWYFQLE